MNLHLASVRPQVYIHDDISRTLERTKFLKLAYKVSLFYTSMGR